MSTLAHDSWGQGSPLLLIHGFTGNREAWSHLRPLLGSRHRVLAADLPGHGESPIAADTTFHGTVEQLLQLLDAQGLERVDVAGYSLGARVALGLCLRAPERVGRLILESGNPGLRRRRDRGERRREDAALAGGHRAGGAGGVRSPLGGAVPLRRPPQPSRGRCARGCTSAGSRNRAGGAGRLAARALPRRPAQLLGAPVDGARADAAAHRRARREVHRRSPGPWRREMPLVWGHVFPGAGHAPHLESPEEWAREVTSFLSAPWIERPLVDSELGSNQG